MPKSLIDLHTHTVHSDGSATPVELVTAAARENARAIAITDHDTLSGLSEARAAAAHIGLELINGIEISAEYSPGTMHILGYFIDDRNQELLSALEKLREAREQRNPEIARRLRQLGVDLDYDEVVQLAGNEVVGRPHFARLLVQKGYTATIQEAFDRFLAKGAAAYVEKRRLLPRESIDLIHAAGGLAVLAHPYQLKLATETQTETLIRELASAGLDGVEAIYSRHTPSQRASYVEMARRHGLLITGGSDYHGTYKPDIRVVKGLGDLEVPYSIVEEMKERASAVARVGVAD